MNYFELFDIPVALRVDTSLLSKKFFQLQRQFHPDYFANASDSEKEEALEQSSMINKAWKTFQREEETIQYTLQLKGLLNDDEKHTLSPSFLMEVMELNEMKMDGAGEADIRQRTQALLDEIKAEVEPIIAAFGPATTEKELLAVKEYYYRKKYIDRLLHAE